MSRALVAAVCGVAFMLSAGANLFADSPDWVLDAIEQATRDPGELYYFHGVQSECPIVDAHAEGVIDAILTGARIQPRHLSQSSSLFDQLYLDLSVSCLDRRDGSFVYAIDAYFAVHSPLGGQRMLIARRFGRIGLGDRTSILQAIQQSVEDAAGAFLTANDRG
ncbi:MAG: hypothetical protein OXJ90_01445 [Spirochaetaceae bacterium]|nr:hypothetical protein [Spirochaetaceae bacterium]